MTALRSALYNIYFFGGTALIVVAMLPLMLCPRAWMQSAVSWLARSQAFGVRWLVGLRYEVRGRENIPEGAVVFASKHQSAWDASFFYIECPDPAYVLKRELLRIPLWGWYTQKCKAINVDRTGGASALKRLVADAQDRLFKHRQVIVFPEGSRIAPGHRAPFHPGIAAIYAHIEAPVVPVALNSGLFWGRRSFFKQSGVIIVEFLPPMPRGLKRRDFMNSLSQKIGDATDSLEAEGLRWFPHVRRVYDKESGAEPLETVD